MADRDAASAFNGAISLDALRVAAAVQIPEFETRWVSFPEKPGEDITLWGRDPTSHPFVGDYGSSATFDPQTAALKTATDLRQAGPWTIHRQLYSVALWHLRRTPNKDSLEYPWGLHQERSP